MGKKHCKRCGSDWRSRKKNPIQCPRCHSPLWDKDYVRKPYKVSVGDSKSVAVDSGRGKGSSDEPPCKGGDGGCGAVIQKAVLWGDANDEDEIITRAPELRDTIRDAVSESDKCASAGAVVESKTGANLIIHFPGTGKELITPVPGFKTAYELKREEQLKKAKACFASTWGEMGCRGESCEHFSICEGLESE